jgi:hypothetical protein
MHLNVHNTGTSHRTANRTQDGMSTKNVVWTMNESSHPVMNVLVSEGCQIVLGKTYQNGKYIPNGPKIYQTAVKYIKGL